MRPITELERSKYERMWEFENYDRISPGVRAIPHFKQMAPFKRGDTLIDIGCGAGAASFELDKLGLKVTGYDIQDTAWRQADNIAFLRGSVWHIPPELKFDYAFCCDMMEHLPTEFVGLTVHNILRAAPSAFFSIAFMDDSYGDLIGETLHLTVKPFTWWRDMFREIGTLVEARDQLRDQGTPSQGVFYVTR